MTAEQAMLKAAVREMESDALIEIAEILDKLETDVQERGGNGEASRRWVIEQLTEVE